MSTNALTWRGASDARIPLSLVTPHDLPAPEVRALSAVLFINLSADQLLEQEWLATKTWQAEGQNAEHAPACACCVNVGGLGRILASLVQERARGICEFFTNVFVVCAPELKEEIKQSLEKNNIVTGLYCIKKTTSSFSCY